MRRLLPLTALLLASCSLTPAYKSPPLPVADHWDVTASPSSDSAIGWHNLFKDKGLQAAIELALKNNQDLRMAVLNMDKAQAAAKITQAQFWPNLSANMAETKTLTPASVSSTGKTQLGSLFTGNLGLSAYEIDLFGRLRALNESGTETALASLEARKAVEQALIAQVAIAYLSLQADIEDVELAQETLRTRHEALDMAQARFKLGAISQSDVDGLETLYDQARLDKDTTESKKEQDQVALRLLVGSEFEAPKSGLGDQAFNAPPVGLTSEVMTQRPDVRAAEHTLKSANANIGAARAAFFPRLTLLGSDGGESLAFQSLFSGVNHSYSYTPQLSVPIFSGGALKYGLKSAQINEELALSQYKKTVEQAFSEVNAALLLEARMSERLAAQTALYEAAKRSQATVTARYQMGLDSYLTLLEAQRSLYAAQQGLISVRLLALTNRISLYKALARL